MTSEARTELTENSSSLVRNMILKMLGRKHARGPALCPHGPHVSRERKDTLVTAVSNTWVRRRFH